MKLCILLMLSITQVALAIFQHPLKKSLASAMGSRRAFISTSGFGLAVGLAGKATAASPVVSADETIMAPKAHGTTANEVQSNLLYGVNHQLADRICSFNRRFAEPATSWQSSSLTAVMKAAGGEPVTFYDSVSGKPLFRAPIGRSVDGFLAESATHGWPSFRNAEVVWDNVRVLKDGETVSVDGTHLGHDLPDRSGNRYCINLVSIAGNKAA